MFLLYPLYVLVRWAHRNVQRFGPTSCLLRWFRKRNNLRWGLLALPLSLVYVAAAVVISIFMVELRWLAIPFLIVLFNGVKLAFWAPLSLIQLAGARLRERRLRCASTGQRIGGADTEVTP